MSLETHDILCPYCGESIEVDIEMLDTVQEYVEDCSICCRPIQFRITRGDEGPDIDVSRSE
jgi:hypothetical protein